jgi:hypothetical protein
MNIPAAASLFEYPESRQSAGPFGDGAGNREHMALLVSFDRGIRTGNPESSTDQLELLDDARLGEMKRTFQLWLARLVSVEGSS